MIRLIFTRKCPINPQLSQITPPFNLNKLTYMTFSKKLRPKRTDVRPPSERKHQSDNEDDDFKEKDNNEEEKEIGDAGGKAQADETDLHG